MIDQKLNPGRSAKAAELKWDELKSNPDTRRDYAEGVDDNGDPVGKAGPVPCVCVRVVHECQKETNKKSIKHIIDSLGQKRNNKALVHIK